MPNKELVIPQSQLNHLTQVAHNLQAGIFRSTSLFKRAPKTRQMVLQPVLEKDATTLLAEVRQIFPEERISVEKGWRKIIINLENVTFSSGKS